MKKHEINKRIIKKISNSVLDKPIQDLLIHIISFEVDEGKNSNRYSGYYEKKIEETVIKLRRGKE